MQQTETFARTLIDAQLKDQDWKISDGISVHYEHTLLDGIVERTDSKTLLPDKLWRFAWNEPVEQAYIHALFQSAHVRRELGKLSSGTSASMRNISQGKLFGLPLPIAPFANQKDFSEKAMAVSSIQSQQTAATAKAQATFDALLAQVAARGTD